MYMSCCMGLGGGVYSFGAAGCISLYFGWTKPFSP
jgi:hypothetical protein